METRDIVVCGAGTEWFLTHLKFLDSTAELLGLKTHFAIDDSDSD